jgi:hypothetical protein
MQIYEESDIRATFKSMILELEQILLRNREPERIIEWYVFRLERDFRPSAIKMIQQLRVILEALKQAQTQFTQEETIDQAYTCMQTALTAMRQMLAGEDEEKVEALQIDLQPDANGQLSHVVCRGRDAWEEANRHLQAWSTPGHEGVQVGFTIQYEDGYEEQGSLTLPLFYAGYQPEKMRIGEALHLGKWIIDAALERLDFPFEAQLCFETARKALLAYLRRYKVGGPAYREEVTKAILRIQEADYSRFSLEFKRVVHLSKPGKMSSFDQARIMPVQATYTPYREIWAYRLCLEGVYDMRATKRLLTGHIVALQGVVQNTPARQTLLDFSILPGNEDPGVEKAGEHVQIEVLRGEVVVASITFHREEDDSFVVETDRCDLTYLSIAEES